MSEVGKSSVFEVDEGTLARIRDLGEADGLSLEAAHEVALQTGLALVERGRIDRALGIERLAQEIEEIKTCLHVLGPATFGANLLLTHWATVSGSLRVTAEELTDEFRRVAGMEWSVEMARRGIVPPETQDLNAASLGPDAVAE